MEQNVESPKSENNNTIITTPEATKETSFSSNNQINSSITKHIYADYGVVEADYEFSLRVTDVFLMTTFLHD